MLVPVTCAMNDTGIVFFQAEDGIRDLVRSRGLGDVYKRQWQWRSASKFLRLPHRKAKLQLHVSCRPFFTGNELSLIHI